MVRVSKHGWKILCRQSWPKVGTLVRGIFERRGCGAAGGRRWRGEVLLGQVLGDRVSARPWPLGDLPGREAPGMHLADVPLHRNRHPHPYFPSTGRPACHSAERIRRLASGDEIVQFLLKQNIRVSRLCGRRGPIWCAINSPRSRLLSFRVPVWSPRRVHHETGPSHLHQDSTVWNKSPIIGTAC